MAARKQAGRPPMKHDNKKSPKAAEQKFGKAARQSAERSGKKPTIWQRSEQRLPGAAPLTSGQSMPGDAITRTIEASASEVYRAFNDPTRRGWSHEPGYAVRATVAPRSLVLGMRDGSTARVSITRKGNVKVLVAIEIAGLPDTTTPEQARHDWRESLGRLGEMLD